MEGRNAAEKNSRYILVVDNNVDDRFQTSMVLQRFGYNICTANTAEESIEFMHVAPPAAIVTESGRIGAGLISRTKKDPRFSDVPLIFLMRTPDLDIELRARKGEFAALRKPLDVEKFYQALQAAVEKTPRKNIRINTSLPATMEEGGESVQAQVTVISEYGMFLRTLDPQPLNARVPVGVEIKGRAIKLEAVVLYSYSLEASPFKEPGMGIKFVKISPEDQAFIKAFILEQVQEGIIPQSPRP